MSTAERVNKQIKALAANSKFLTSIINENEIANIQKKVDSLKSESPEKELTATSSSVVYSDKEICFDSMLQLTNFILYNDYPNETDCISKRKYLQTSRCTYNLTKTDLKEIDSFAKELDTIQTDLAEIHDNLRSYKKSYLIYCESLMRFIDQKEVLMSLFLNYYDEYFLRKKETTSMSTVKKYRHGSDSCYSAYQNAYKSSNKKPKKQKQVNNMQPMMVKRTDVGYMSDDSCFATFSVATRVQKKLGAANSTVYVSSIPTENRFALLARNKCLKTKS